MSILIVGTVAFDAIETPFGKTEKIVGGAATYISLSSSFFSKELNLVSVVGEDFPSSAITMLEEHNVCTKGLQIKEGEKTFFWSGKYHNDMNTRDTVETQLNVLETFDPVVPEEYNFINIIRMQRFFSNLLYLFFCKWLEYITTNSMGNIFSLHLRCCFSYDVNGYF